MTLYMPHHSDMGHRWWAEAVNTAATLISSLPDLSNAVKPPIEAITGHKPDLSKAKVFGCKGFLLVRKSYSSDKLATKAQVYKLYDMDHQIITHGVHVKFHELEFFTDSLELDTSILEDKEDEAKPPPLKAAPPDAQFNSKPPSRADPNASWNQAMPHFRTPPFSRESIPGPVLTTETPSATPRYPICLRAPSRKFIDSGLRTPQSDFIQDTASLSIDGVEYACLAHPITPDNPQSRKETVSGPDRNKWIISEKAEPEYQRQLVTHTTPSPDGSTDADRNINRQMTRLVCQGFSQIPGIDFTDTLPVVKMRTIRTILVIVTSLGMEADADNAYIQADLNTLIYAR